MGLFDGLKSMFGGKKADITPAADAATMPAAPVAESTTASPAPAPEAAPVVTAAEATPAPTAESPAAPQAEVTAPGMPQGATFSENAAQEPAANPTDQQQPPQA